MNELLEDYGWATISLIGGMIGLSIFISAFFGSGSSFSTIVNNVLEGLM